MTWATVLAILIQAAATTGGVRGQVVDATGAAVAGAEVVASVRGRVVERLRSDAAGRFSIASAAEGLEVVISAPGFADARLVVPPGTPVLRVRLEPASIQESITVAAQPDAGRLRTPGSVTTLDRPTLEALPALTVDEQLRTVPGFTLFRRSSSRVANPTTQGVTLRGLAASGASRTLVLADGIPLNDPFGGWVYWDRIPAAAIDRVDVTRGGASDLHGSDALGGVVRIDAARGSGAHVLVEGGGDATFRGSGYGGTNAGRSTLFGAAEHFTTDGFVTVTPESRGSIDVPATSRHSSAYGGTRTPLGGHGSVRLVGSYFSEDRGNGTPFQTNATTLRQLAGSVDREGWGGLWTVHAYGATQGYDQTFSAIAADRRSERPTSTQRVTSRFGGGSVEWARAWSRQVWLFGATYRDVDATLEERTLTAATPAPVVTDARQRSTGLVVQSVLTPASSFTVGAGLRGEFWQSERQGSGSPANTAAFVAPRASIAWRAGEAVSLRAGVQSGYRFPTINELYRPFRVGNVLTMANDGLEPERSTGVEGAVFIRRGDAGVRVVAFWTRLTDAIANVTLEWAPSLILRQRQNAGGIRAAGAELEAELRLSRVISVIASGAFIDSVFTDAPGLEGLDVPQVPNWQSAVSARVAARGALVAVQWRTTGAQFDDDRNLLRLDATSVVDARAGWQARRGLELFAAVENAFDAEQPVGRTPILTIGLPRTARGGLRLTF